MSPTTALHDVVAAVDAFVALRAPGVAIAGDTPMFALGLLDSVALVDLVALLEDTLGIVVLDEELVPSHFATRDRIVDFVRRKREER